MKFMTCLALVVTLGVAAPALAEINVAPSLEWLTCSAEVIVVGTLGKIDTTRGPGDVTYDDCVVDARQVIKGDVGGKPIEFTLRRVGTSPRTQPLRVSAEEVLLFLSKSKDHGPERRLDDRWVPTMQGMLSIVNLSKPLEKVYSKDMKIVTDKDELLKIVQGWAKSPIKESLNIDVPFGSPIFSKLWAGSTCYLIVPAEAQYRDQFLKQARSPKSYDRAKAAKELGKFPGPETEAVLRELLEDDAESFANDSQDHISRVRYHVRAAAHASLKALGKAVPDIQIERKPTADEQRALRKKCWTDSFETALKGDWRVSAVDGLTRVVGGRERTVVVVTCHREKQEARFRVVPREWPAGDLPEEECLGANGLNSQGARRFYLNGELPADLKKHVVGYFGLEK